jgi:hypothetical protein
VAVSIASVSAAAAKDEYRAASVNGLPEIDKFRIADDLVRNVVAWTKDKKIVVGRGEIMFIS